MYCKYPFSEESYTNRIYTKNVIYTTFNIIFSSKERNDLETILKVKKTRIEQCYITNFVTSDQSNIHISHYVNYFFVSFMTVPFIQLSQHFFNTPS